MRVEGEKLKDWIDYLRVAATLRPHRMGAVMGSTPLIYDTGQNALVSSDTIGRDIVEQMKRQFLHLGFEGGIVESPAQDTDVNYTTTIRALDANRLAPRQVSAKERTETQRKLAEVAEKLDDLIADFKRELPYDRLPSTVQQALRDHRTRSTDTIGTIAARIENPEPERAKPHHLTLTMFDAFRLFAWANAGARNADVYQRFELSHLVKLNDQVKKTGELIASDRTQPVTINDVERVENNALVSVRKIAEQVANGVEMVSVLIEDADKGARKLRPSFAALRDKFNATEQQLDQDVFRSRGFSDRVEDALLDAMFGRLMERKQEQGADAPNTLLDQIKDKIKDMKVVFDKRSRPMFMDAVRLDESKRPPVVVLEVADTTSFNEVAKALNVQRGALGRKPLGHTHEVHVNVQILTAALGIPLSGVGQAATPNAKQGGNLGELSEGVKQARASEVKRDT